MTPERRAQILRHIPTLACLDELSAFRSGLSERQELGDADVLQAIRDRQDVLNRTEMKVRRA
jgi:hypothetical protein